jgi:two-component sensor histidine kinase
MMAVMDTKNGPPSRKPFATRNGIAGPVQGEAGATSMPRWYWIGAIWAGIALWDATQTVVVMRAEHMQHRWTYLFITQALGWLPWALATPIVLRLGWEHPLRWKKLTPWLAHGAACACIGLAYAALVAGIETLLDPWAYATPPGPYGALLVQKFFDQLLSSVILYGCVLLVGYLLESRERLARQQMEAARLNEQLSKAQLNALRQQIEPHFLFNTLNAVAGLIREGRSDAAVNMIAALSDLLRRVVNDSQRQEVPLGEELEFLRKYLDIQKARFAERLELRVEVPGELCRAWVPSLILQPIVENAVKHGIAKRAEGGAIEISAARVNGVLTLNVYNDGPQLAAEWEKNGGIGLSNVRTRLESLYGDQFELRMGNEEARGVRVAVSVPWRE